MTNVINFQQLEEEMLPVLHLHDVSPDYREVVYMYDSEYMGIAGLPIFLGDHVLLSIKTIQNYIKYQQSNKLTIVDEYKSTKKETWNEFLNKSDVIICSEGAFFWDIVGKEFIWIGELKDTIASTNVRIDESFRICFGEESIFLDECCEYQLELPYKHSDKDGKVLDMLVVKEEGGAFFVIPDDSRFVTKGYKDLALIGEPYNCGEC